MKIVTPNKNGQVSIPAAMRKALRIDQNTLLQCEMRDGVIIYMPIQVILRKSKVISRFGSKKNFIVIPTGKEEEDSEDSIMKDISGGIAQCDEVVNEPDLYDSHYGKDSL